MKECKHDLICIAQGVMSNGSGQPPTFKCKRCLRIFTFKGFDEDDLTEIKINLAKK